MIQRFLTWVTILMAVTTAAGAFQHEMPGDKIHTGTVVETMNSGNYTYIHIDDDGLRYWMATSQTAIEKGAKIRFVETMWMEDFNSKMLGRTFDKIMFVDNVKNLDTMALPHTEASAMKVSENPDYKLEGGHTVAKLYEEGKRLDGKTVKVRGKVAKVSTEIMGKNWVHIVDGTSSKSNDRVVFTTKEEPPAVGNIVTASGTLAADKDFGYGYFYPVIVENASFR